MPELACTPGQTVGPFLHLGLPCRSDLVDAGDADAIRLHGTVYDGAGDPIPDAVVELWQSGFAGWGRAATDAAGQYSFTTVLPGAPFFALTVFARGLLDRLFTRAYLPGADLDATLAAADAERRATLWCVAESSSAYRFDIHLQGPRETLFLAYRGAGT
jgi:protocatechuate 3,4-dioxygenase, alpha subunit